MVRSFTVAIFSAAVWLFASSITTVAAPPASPGTSLLDTVDLSVGTDVYLPRRMAVNHATHKLYVVGYYSGFQNYGVKVINTTNNTVVAGIDLGRYVVGTDTPRASADQIAVDESAAPAGNRIYVAGFGGFSNSSLRVVLRIIDGGSDTVLNGQGQDLFLPIGNPVGIAVNPTNHEVYVIDQDGNVAVVDGPNGRMITTLSTSVGSTQNAIVADPATNKVFAFGSKGAAVIDSPSDTFTPLTVNFTTTKGVYNSANGRLYFVGQDANGVFGIYVLDGSGGAIATRTAGVPYDSRGITVDPGSNTLYIGAPTLNAAGPVAAFNASDLSPKGSFTIGTAELAFDSVNGGRLFSLDYNYSAASPELRNMVGVLNPADGTLQKVTVGYRPHEVAVNSKTNRIYIADEQAPELVVLDGTSRGVIARVATNPGQTAPQYNSAVSPRHMAVSVALDRIYLTRTADDPNTGQQSSYVDILDGTSHVLLQSLTINTAGLSNLGFVAVDDTRRRLYVTGTGYGGLSGPAPFVAVYDLSNNSLITTVPLPSSLTAQGGIAVNPVTGRLYVDGGAGFGGNNVVIIDGATNQIVTTVSAGAVPGPIAINTKTNKVYVANTGAGSVDNSVTVINGATDTVETTFSNTNSNTSGDAVTSVAVDEVTNTIYVGDNANQNDFHGWVTVFGGASNNFLGQIDVGRFPASLTFNTATRQLFATNNEDGTISVLGNGSIGPIPPAPAHGGLSATVFAVNGSKQPAYPGPTPASIPNLADTVLRFAALQTGVPAGLEVSVQATTTPGDATSWTNLPNGNGGFMSYDASTQQFVLSSTNYPLQNGVYFRAKSVATSYPDSISNVVGPFNLATNQSHLGPTTLYMSRNGPVANIRFGVTETTIPSGITVRIETTDKPANEASWVDAPIGSSGHLIQDLQPPPGNPNEFYLGSDDYPSGEGVYFRAVASAQGSIDSISSVFGPFAFILDPAPTIGITISVPPGGTTSGSGTIDDPVVVSSRSFKVTATAHSGRQIKYLALKYDGDTLQSFDGADSEGNTVQYATNIPGDHLIEAVARDDIGVVGDAPPLHIRVAPSAPGQIFTMIQSGDWSTAANWNDSQGNIGVPGPNDFAVLGSNSASLSQDVTVNAVSLGVISPALNGGTVSGPATLTVTGFCTIGSGRVTNDLTIAAGAVCELINDDDIGLGGHVTNYGTWKVHGKGGITGIPKSTSQKAMLVNGTSDVSPFGFFDGVVAFFKNVGDFIFHRPAGGRPGSGSAKPRPPNPPPAPDNRRLRVNIEQAGGKIVADTGDGVVSHDGASVVSHDGASLITNDGGSLIGPSTNVVSHDGGSVVSHDGGSVISQDGGGLVATGGGNLVSDASGTLVSDASSTFQTSGGSNSSAQNVYAATAASGFTQTGGETDLSSISIVGPVTLNGGVLSGSGVIQGDLTNNGGYISPGHSAGLLAVTGNFTQGANGTLIVENGGPSPSQFDQLQIGGVANLGGKLDIKTINAYTPDATDTFSPLGYGSVSGSFASVSSNAQVTVNASGLLTSVDPTKPQPSSGQPLNIATRMSVQTGDNVLIAGFIVTGPSGSTKKVLIRGIGPSLSNFGISGTLSDPLLELHKPDGSVVVNDNWQQGDTSQIPNGFAPSDPRESVIVATLAPGNYSAVLKGAHGETGVGLAEVYDLDSSSSAQLANISTRGFVNTGDNVMIGGFIVGGAEPAKVLVRAIGPSLAAFGVQGALPATTLELHDANGAVISNEGWRNTQEADITATTIPPSNDNEAAILATLVPGNYTAVVRGKNDTTGIAVVEAYDLQ